MENSERPLYNEPGPSSYPMIYPHPPTCDYRQVVNGRNTPHSSMYGASHNIFPQSLHDRGGGSPLVQSQFHPPHHNSATAPVFYYPPQETNPSSFGPGHHYHSAAYPNYSGGGSATMSPLPKQLTLSPMNPPPSLPKPHPSTNMDESKRLLSSRSPLHPDSLHLPLTNPPQPTRWSPSSLSLTPDDAHLPPPGPPPQQRWTISSRRPRHPSDAFAIIISPRAHPPPEILAGAVQLPPSSRPPMSSKRAKPTLETPKVKDGIRETGSVHSPPDNPELPSSSTVETIPACSTAPDTSVSASPFSSNSSVSASLPTSPSLVPANTVVSSSSSIVSLPISPAAPAEVATARLLPISQTATASVKKSWASLLRPTNSTPSAANAINTLPTSSMVGFSIPAQSNGESDPIPHASPSKSPDLLTLLSSGPSITAGFPQIRPRGLVNTGNICFANAVLQVLVYCPPFYRLFTELGKYISDPVVGGEKSGKETPLVEATVEFLKEFNLPRYTDSSTGMDSYQGYDDGLDSFIPSYVYSALKDKKRFDNMRGGHQEDAEEFLGFFLDTLEEELLSMSASVASDVPFKPIYSKEGEDPPRQDGWVEVGKRNKLVVTRTNKSVDSPITRIFGGKFRSTLKVPGQRDSVLVEDWRSLQLDIQREQVRTIEDALRHISLPQAVQVASVTKGGAIVDASQQVLVDSLPPILVLHLKRFLYDTKTKGVVKISKGVAFGSDLELPLDIISPARRPAQPVKFKLFAVVYHHGQSAGGGHYTLDVLHPNRNADLSIKAREGWIRIDDELVSDLRTQDVFGSDLDDRCAYLLFYKRVGGAHSRT